MRRIILFCLWFGACLWGMAQTRESATQVGAASGSAEWNNGQDSAFMVFNIGGIVNTPVVPVGPFQESVSGGFPYPVKYFSNVFAQDFFISKGYFPDVIQLQWDIESNADRIERFLIYRKPLGSTADSTLIASISADDFSFSDETIQQGTLYKYTVFAKGIIDEFRIPFVNIIEGTGFAFPVGSASGRITYEGGTAVEGVTVIAETEGNLRGQSILLDGVDDFLSVSQTTSDTELNLSAGFTFQMWIDFEGTPGEERILFSKGETYRLAYDGEQLRFEVNNDELILPFMNPVDSFFHISAVFDPTAQALKLFALVSEERQESISGVISDLPASATQSLLFGRDLNGNFYHGYLEEIRLWNSILSDEEIQSNYSRFISGQEEGLAGYWKLDAGVGEDFYDFAQPNPGDFTENHGQVFGGQFSDKTPLNSQLAFRGITDRNGNFIITGFPFEGNGSLYRFTPTLGVHAFEPTERIRFVGPSEAIHNEMDFDDISSFPVSGTVRYKNMPFPVEGAFITVDDKPAQDATGGLVRTDELGQFEVDVPIGFHSVGIILEGHEFELGGRFPTNPSQLFDFQQPLSGIEFIDNTLIRVVGKVVGGPVEGEKNLGFGLSKNNIGNAVISLQPEKLADLSFSEFPFDPGTGRNDSTILLEEDHFQSEVSFSLRQIRIFPDELTGEFVALLPPEDYTVTDVSTTNYDFGDEYNVSLKTSLFENIEVRQDTILSVINNDTTTFIAPFSEADYDSVFTVNTGGNLYQIATDTFQYNTRSDFVLRNSPTLTVTNLEGEEVFGDSIFVHTNDDLGVTDTITLYTDGGSSIDYHFGHPIFTQRSPYTLEIKLFEAYNDENGNLDQVPVVDGTIAIANNLTANDQNQSLELDHSGKVRYTFKAGFPNITRDNVNANNSFTKTLNITAFSGNEGSIQTVWRSTDPFRGIIFGAIPFGNNFVTAGPNQVMAILRDPPGSASSTTLATGTTRSETTSWNIGQGVETQNDFVLVTGMRATSGVGLGSFVINENKDVTIKEFGFGLEQSFRQDNSITNSLTTEREYSTSDDPGFVGPKADLFIGFSTNLVYGRTSNLELVPINQCDFCGDIEFAGYKLGTSEGIRIDPEFETGFVYTQTFIEDQLITGLEHLRNNKLIYSNQPDTINAINDPVYISLIDKDDEKYGTNNADDIWGDQRSTDIGSGPSYVINFPTTFTLQDSLNFVDSVLYFNSQILGWENVLHENERQKVQSVRERNISFDGGTAFTESVTNSRSDITTNEFSLNLNKEFNASFSKGATVFGTHFQLTMLTEAKVTVEGGFGNEVEVDSTTTYSFTLADGDVGDAYTVDVLKPQDGFGPVFKTRGGATSCPYEGESVTSYFQPGTPLNFATAQREKPALSVEQSVVRNVPENRAAEYIIHLRNESETGDGFLMDLDIVDGTNPFGAIIEVDGTPLGNGLSFLVNAGETLTKTLTLLKGSQAVFDYENIGIVLASQCQSDPTDILPDILDEIRISAFFQSGCSDITVSSPSDQWVLNSLAIEEDVVPVEINEFDLNFENFQRIDFQYKPSSSSQWITNMRFYNPESITEVVFDALDEPKTMISGSSIEYSFNMDNLPDRSYDIRAVTKCVLAPGVEVETPSTIVSGIKDTQRPRVFGAPQPADGILSTEDEISLRFSEPIEEGLLTPNNFSIRGVLNNTPITNNTSVKFDGVNDYMRIEEGLTLANDFTIFFWLRREVFGEDYVIFSKGTGEGNRLEIGFNTANQFTVNVSGQIITSSLDFSKTSDSDWEYYAVSYNEEDNELFAYRNGASILERVALTNEFTGDGSIAVGKSAIFDNHHYQGNIHELRIWNTYRQLTDVVANQSVSLSGNELGLAGYWPMNEGKGSLAIDKARARNGTLFADWQIDPQGYSSQFDGVDDYLEIPTASTVTIEEDQDFTIEFWFNAASGQAETVLFSSGKADGTDEFSDPDYSWNIGIGTDGDLFVLHNGIDLPLEGTSSFIDDNWHHFALSLNRTGNLNVFIDEQQQASVSPANYGGLAGAEMWIGAQGYKTGTISSVQDQFFNGWIDEFRIWNTTRSLNQISANLNIAQESDEIGLVAYYPFEFFEIQAGVPLRTSSLKDLTEESAGSATAFGGADFSMNTANIRAANPVSNIDFDWVVNDDEIIFNINKSFSSLIEQTIVTIAARGIEDKLQNRMASPVSWTAFIDRNQVKWDNTELEISKLVYETAAFKVDVLNLGGSEESFEITNLPPWLSASPAAGTLAPNSSTAVEFTINSGLNTGYYQEDIFLTSDFGFDEKLSLDLSVFSQAPDWTFNARDFQYSMNVVGQLEINGIISRDENDQVAAFVDGELRGVVNVDYVQAVDAYLAYLTIYSNVTSGESVEIRVWDASEGIEYRGNVIPEITFQTNELLGSDSSPITIQVGNTLVQEVVLDRGWNWVSFAVDNSNFNNLDLILQDLPAEAGFQIKSQQHADVYTPGIGWRGSLTNAGGFQSGEMYRFFVGDTDLEVVGIPIDVRQRTINLTEGWNWLGFTPRFNQTVNEALEGLQNVANGDVIKSQFLFAVYRENIGWIGTLEFMEPGRGYLIRKTNADTFTYPETTGLARTRSYQNQEIKQTRNYEGNMTVLSSISGLFEAGVYELQVVDEKGNFRGAITTTYVDGKPYYFLNVQGSVNEQLQVFAQDLETGTIYESKTSLTFNSDQHLGSIDHPVVFDFETNDQNKLSDLIMYPNPFEDRLSVQFPGTKSDVPTVWVADLSGKLVRELRLDFESNEQWITEWNGRLESGSKANSGIYVLMIQLGDQLSSYKISLK